MEMSGNFTLSGEWSPCIIDLVVIETVSAIAELVQFVWIHIYI